MAIGKNWANIWNEDIWNTAIWAQSTVTPPVPVASTGNARRHTLGLTTFSRR